MGSTNSLKLRLGAIVAVSMLAGGLMTGTAMAIQGHMWNARAALERAGAQLQAAAPDKAGHRVAAMSDVNAALSEVNAGISAGAE
jgi:hypothetical protein